MPAAAAVQMTSVADVAANLASADRLLRAAHMAGAALVVLPENFSFMGAHERDKLAIAETDGEGPIQTFLAGICRELGLWVVAGTIPLRSPRDPHRVAAACLVFDGRGQRVVRYDKIHLFDVDLPDREESYRESVSIERGTVPVTVQTPCGRLGLAVCYDIRFPELFRRLGAQGAQLLSLPAAFTVPTGEAHWEMLLRARAVENLCYVVAAAQWGRHASGRHTYGHSMIVEPWGRVVQDRSDGEGVVVAEIDLTSQEELRRRFPVLSHRRF